ncbi:hypothetical protein ACIGW8_39195 [Streptomyces sioyaensis]|uniref:hypothetical protein n=1 Tax=Streptomyces sioyaensis TaxID=67364 RepID=UPI0037CF6592
MGARIIPTGVAVAAVCALLLAVNLPLAVVHVAIAVLSLGYDMTHPLLGGIVTDLPRRPDHRGQALGLNAFCLFTGFGLVSLVFEFLLPRGFTTALVIFGVAALLAAVAAVPAFTRRTGTVRVCQTNGSVTESVVTVSARL